METETAVACKWCGELTMYTGTKECDSCHRTAFGLLEFLGSKKARAYTLQMLAQLEETNDED